MNGCTFAGSTISCAGAERLGCTTVTVGIAIWSVSLRRVARALTRGSTPEIKGLQRSERRATQSTSRALAVHVQTKLAGFPRPSCWWGSLLPVPGPHSCMKLQTNTDEKIIRRIQLLHSKAHHVPH